MPKNIFDSNKQEFNEKKKKTVKVEMINGNIEIENNPLCKREQISEASKVIEEHVPKIIEGLPDGHPWKGGKLVHRMFVISESERSIRKYFGDALSEENYVLMSFLASVHDLGRAIEAKKKLGILPEDYRRFSQHGEESVNLLKDWGALNNFSQDTQEIIKYVILHHADKSSPALPENPTELDKLKHFYTCIFRDSDKLALFRDRTDAYLKDEGEKIKQTQVNNLIGETGKIEPEELTKTFSEFYTIDRSKCKSYEAFMLQYLAWIFDLNLKTSLKEAVDCGAIPKILNYFKKSLSPEQYNGIYKTTENYLNKAGHSLEKDH